MSACLTDGDVQPVTKQTNSMSAPESRITILDPTSDPAWDTEVLPRTRHTFFHTSAWAKVLRDSYGYRPLYLASFEKKSVSAALPVMEVNSWLTGRRGVSLPFTDECGPIGAEAQESRRMVEEAIKLGRERGWRYFLSQGAGNLFDETKRRPASYFGHFLELQKPGLFDGFDDSIRRGIRKAQRSGVQVKVQNSLEALQCYYRLHCQTRKRHGLPPQPWSFFAQIHRHVLSRDLGFVALARHQERPVAGAVFFHSDRQAVFKYGASDTAYQALRGNNLVMWEGIQRLAQKGVATLSFGRTSVSNEGLRRFKLGWNSSEQELRYLKYNYQTESFASEKDGTHGWHTEVFRRIPQPVSRLIGAILYRHWGVSVLGLETLSYFPRD